MCMSKVTYWEWCFNNQNIPRYTAYTAYVTSAIRHLSYATALAYVGHELQLTFKQRRRFYL